MTNFIEAWNGETQVLLNPKEIQRIGLTKSTELRQSERAAKVVFADGSKGEYVVHRNVVKELKGQLKSCNCNEAAEA